MNKRLLLSLLATAGLMLPAQPSLNQPVYIVLYTRFYDHGLQHPTDERLQRLIPMIEKIRKEHPESGMSAVLQFSGTVSQRLAEENDASHIVDRLKDLAAKGVIDLGYTGEDEPTYMYRPKADVLGAPTPEARWLAEAKAAEKFLNDFKNPLTGLPVPGLTGGLRRTQEVFGPVQFASGLTDTVGGDSPAFYELAKLNQTAVIMGVPANDPRRGIESFGNSAIHFAKIVSPDITESPELYWENGRLRLSETSYKDTKAHSTDEPVDVLKKYFAGLDRTHPRIIKIEVVAYKRYLRRRPDGSVAADPLEWRYYHPDNPEIPYTMHAMVDQLEVEAGYKRDAAGLKWLVEEFLPGNPGSRIVSMRDLTEMAADSKFVSASEIKDMATSLKEYFDHNPMEPPNFVRAGKQSFSLAESFSLLARSLAGIKSGKGAPETLERGTMWGPFTLPNEMGATGGEVSVKDVIKAASEMAPAFANSKPSDVPKNVVPLHVNVGSLNVNATQFLNMMARAYLEPNSTVTLKITPATLGNIAAFVLPKNTPIIDQGNAWTIKPAPLKLTPKGNAASAAGE